MVNFGYPYNDIVICKDSTDYLWSLEDLTGLFLAPKIFRKEMDNISVIFLCTLLKMFQFVEIVVLLTKI